MDSLWQHDRFQWPSRLISPDLSDRARHVGLALYGFADGQTGECWPSFATISEMIGKSVDTVRRAIRELESADMLTVERGDGRGNSTRYWLHLPQLKDSNVATLYPKRVAAVRLKGSKSPHPYKDKPNQRTNARARDDDPWHDGHLKCIEAGSSHEQGWRQWLTDEGLGDWSTFDLVQRDGTIVVPFTFPPDPSHPVEPSLARKWFSKRKKYLSSFGINSRGVA